MWRALVFALVTFLSLLPSRAAPRPADAARVVRTSAGRVTVDWTEARLVVVGAGAPDLRAPGPEVARVGAERVARQVAEKRLRDAVYALPWAKGGTVGAASVEPVVAARLEAFLASPKEIDVRFASDGAVEVAMSVSLHTLSTALTPPSSKPVRDATLPSAIVVDARKLNLAPALGIAVCASKTCYAGPAIWFGDRAAALRDRRVGTQILAASATSQRQGIFQLAASEATVALAAKAGALIVVVGAGL